LEGPASPESKQEQVLVEGPASPESKQEQVLVGGTRESREQAEASVKLEGLRVQRARGASVSGRNPKRH
jgi:hypothetical protein